MRLPRNVKIARSYLDPAPYAGVFFCTLIFVLLGSLVYTPGVLIQLPSSSEPLSGVAGPRVAVAMDKNGQLYFENRLMDEVDFQERLKIDVRRAAEPLTLVVKADQDVTLKQIDHLRDLAAAAGVKQISQEVLPRIFDVPAEHAAQ